MRKTNQKGFTIIELLVVIVIIGILVALALPQLFAAQARGRDSERKNDLKNVKTQLETYFNDNGEYPAAPLAVGNSPKLTAEDLEPPKAGETYVYTPVADANGALTSYTLTTDLENDDDPADADDGTDDGEYTVFSVNQPDAPVTP